MSFVHLYIDLLSIVILGCNLIGPDGGREEAAGGDRGDVEGTMVDVDVGAGEDDGS